MIGWWFGANQSETWTVSVSLNDNNQSPGTFTKLISIFWNEIYDKNFLWKVTSRSQSHNKPAKYYWSVITLVCQ